MAKATCVKGRRLTVGKFLGRMRAERWTAEAAAEQFELPVEAAYEALEYGERHHALIADGHGHALDAEFRVAVQWPQ